MIVNPCGLGCIDDTGDLFNTNVLDAIRVAAYATNDTIYAFDDDGFSASITHGIPLRNGMPDRNQYQLFQVYNQQA